MPKSFGFASKRSVGELVSINVVRLEVVKVGASR